MQQVYNFAAGPAVLPQPVLQQVKDEFLSYHNSGMSITEISHRSSLFQDIIDDAEKTLRDLMQIPDDYAVLFVQGGGSQQFTEVPLNLGTDNVAYIDTGNWSKKAIAEAQKFPSLKVTTLASSEATHNTTIPSVPPVSANYDYVHITTNNTIEGTTYFDLPNVGENVLVGDMSSNILAQRYNVQDFGLIYAGAQKNIAPAGLTIVIVRRDLIGKKKGLPAMLDYGLQSAKGSLYNTPPVFNIYMAGLVFHWLEDCGGVDEMEKVNRAKAKILYDYLDQSKLFSAPVKPAFRSLTNVPFVTGNAAMDQKFITAATEANLLNLKGHRLVGGMRASLYNAMPITGVTKLVHFMAEFEQGEK
ncbi:3-phosphoserine/phosphohydroxythreonine transaminase [Loigolactobacillus iwatensis]|uniref:3-phosphoserine/phosphohydroxythreonine transaminase n=1 Tax=Loigolactobacillus iwatensis TaxID=1267156 RepID=UPI000F7D5FCA|nr:3-phosphoserine/phosphohydroxythreonine transaminase [Loigolactobacillus iwatensis]